jgi:hypothetical protein
MKIPKISNAELGLYIYFFIEKLVPVFCFLFVCGQIAREYYNRLQDSIDSWSLILGMVPHKNKTHYYEYKTGIL